MKRVITATFCAILIAGTAPTTALARQPAGSNAPTIADLDTASLGTGRFARMHTLLEKTLLKVDVLTLDLRFGVETERRITDLVAAAPPALADSIADVAARSTDVFARLEFVRNVSLGQFLGGIRDNLRRARQAGYIDGAEHDEISDGLPRWYAFLDDRGIAKGDVMLYRVRGDQLRVVYIGSDGSVLLDRSDPGAHRRLAVLGSYFARGSDFRDGLIRSAVR